MEYQENKSEFIFEDMLEELKELINIHTIKIIKKYREDLKQELLMGIFEGINNFKIINKIDLYNNSFQDLILKYEQINKDTYYKSFIEKYIKDQSIIDIKDENMLKKLIYEYNLFCNENQFRKLIDLICRNKSVDFYRKNKVKENDNIVSLNLQISDGTELIDTISDNYYNQDITKIDRNLLSDDDNKFIDAFCEGNCILKEKEVAAKLGVSQQAVSSMLKRVKQRYKDKLHKFSN